MKLSLSRQWENDSVKTIIHSASQQTCIHSLDDLWCLAIVWSVWLCVFLFKWGQKTSEMKCKLKQDSCVLAMMFSFTLSWMTSSSYPERETEGGPGGALLYFASRAVDLCRHNQLHRRSTQAPVPSLAPPSHTVKIRAARQHSRAVFGDRFLLANLGVYCSCLILHRPC